MITAIVRYKLPPTIGKNECLAHFHKIAPGFCQGEGLRPQAVHLERERRRRRRLSMGDAGRRQGVLHRAVARRHSRSATASTPRSSTS